MALDGSLYRAVPPKEAIEYLQNKVALPSQNWNGYPDAQQDAIFTVAGAKAHLVNEIRQAVLDSLQQGQTLQEFTNRFQEIAHHWTGARARIIYQTNMRMAYSAGRYAHQLDPQVLKLQPYLKYVHSDAAVPRPHHQALDGQVFEATKIPFAVPNGFGCGCRYVSLSQQDLETEGLTVSKLRRGDVVETPAGPIRLEPEPGFDYVPGQSSPERRRAVLNQSIEKLPDYLKRQVYQQIDNKLKMIGF